MPEMNDKENARKFIDKGIALAKKQYNPDEINNLVNGDDVIMDGMRLSGKSNTIRELYILKSDIENCNPSFDVVMTIKDLLVVEDRVYNICYRTDW